MNSPVGTDELRKLAASAREEDSRPAWALPGEPDEWLLIEDAADELDRLRGALADAREASDRYSQELSERCEQSALNEGRLQQERDRLLTVIENAPHQLDCNTQPGGILDPSICTCWKADAL